MTNRHLAETRIETILRCPITGSDLVWLDPPRIDAVNQRILRGEAAQLDGSPIRYRLESALACPGERLVYPVKDGIVILLPSLAIAATREAAGEARRRLGSTKQDAMDFYDSIGWRESRQGVYEDAARFEDLRAVASEYVHRCHLRVGRYLRPQGRYLLDIASGPVQYPEYLAYSSGYDYRVCADISFMALRQAQQKVGERGVYLLCDITNLPVKDETLDGFVSLHTLYHVPAEEQLKAVGELYRVLTVGGSGVIVYSWGDHSLLMNLITPALFPLRSVRGALRRLCPECVVDRLRRMRGGRRGSGPPGCQPGQAPGSPEEPKLYFHAHDPAWYEREVRDAFGAEIVSWRSVSVPFMRRVAHERLLGRRLLSSLFWMEGKFPRFFGRYGQYPMFVFEKAGSPRRLAR